MSFLRVLARVFSCKLMMDFGFGTSYPYYLTFNITNKCNSRCKTCFLWKTYVENPELQKQELSLTEINRLFKDIPAPLWLTFSGGEPILRSDLLEICRSAYKNYPDLHGLGILTNGLSPDKIVDFINDLLCVGFRNVKASVSIDGTEKMNDLMRGGKGGFKKA